MKVIELSKAKPVDFWTNARRPKPKAYAGTWKGVPIAILGSYETVCGGMDTITDINDARLYIPGEDDVRKIDWSVTARTTVPYVRDTISDRELEVWVGGPVEPHRSCMLMGGPPQTH